MMENEILNELKKLGYIDVSYIEEALEVEKYDR